MSLKNDIDINLPDLSEADFDRLREWLDEGLYENPGRFSGMSYERGIEHVLDWLAGEITIDELCESRD